MIVTIDGPAGAGKSSVARKLAQRLGYRFLDTGAMYRAVALAAIRRQHDWQRVEALVELARTLEIHFVDGRLWLNGEDVTDAIRAREVTRQTHYAADNPGVRQELVRLQRQAVGGDSIVTEGRDQGTVVFPEAGCKIFLTASAEERAGRRHRDMVRRGEKVSLEQVMAEQEQRDLRDERRSCGPLKRADDAIEVLTDKLTEDEVVARLETLVRAAEQRAAESPAN